jgi:hypothetical protein
MFDSPLKQFSEYFLSLCGRAHVPWRSTTCPTNGALEREIKRNRPRTPGRLIVAFGFTLLAMTVIPEGEIWASETRIEKRVGNVKLQSSLGRYFHGDFTKRDLEKRGYRFFEDRIQVVIETERGVEEEISESLEILGASRVSTATGLVQAEISLDLVGQIAEIPGVVLIRKPIYAEHPEPNLPPPAKLKSGVRTTEGLSPLNATAWHNAGITGIGVRVGVIDSSFGGYEALLGSDLPAAFRTHYRNFGSATLDSEKVHGTGCAEIIHDIAPDAELFLAHIETGVDFRNALNWLRTNNVDVVSMSLGWYFPGPGDGTGWMQSEIASDVDRYGRLWFVSAGNSRKRHWQTTAADSDGNGWVEMNPGEVGEVNYLVDSTGVRKHFDEGDEITVRAVWNDWTRVSADYDLALYRYDETSDELVEAARADDPQSGNSGESPTETLNFEVTTPGNYAFAIYRYDVAGSHDLEVFSSDYLQHPVEGGSLGQPSDTPQVVSVAASDFSGSYGIHSYSSKGPTNGPGGRFTGGEVKPDLTGYAGVSTVSYGYRGFFGTSAACPHAAGAGALVRAAAPAWSGPQVRSFLETKAIDRGPVGRDTDYGYGRLYLGSPTALPPPGGGGGSCDQDLNGGVVCLRDGRFEFIGSWTSFSNPPATQPLIWTPVENINATAGFQSNPSGIQIVMRVADGCSLTGTWWVWLGGFTDAGWNITVRDTVTGKTRIFNRARQGGVFPTTERDKTTFNCN